MLVACRLAGLSALILDYAVKVARAQFGPTQSTLAFKPLVSSAVASNWAMRGSAMSAEVWASPPLGRRRTKGTRTVGGLDRASGKKSGFGSVCELAQFPLSSPSFLTGRRSAIARNALSHVSAGFSAR
jgi:hypothetical protein